MEKTIIEKAAEDIRDKVYTEVRKLYPAYEKVVSDYHVILNHDMYAKDYKLEEKRKAMEKITSLKEEHTNKALEELEKVVDKYDPQQEPIELSDIEKLTKVIIYKDMLEDLPKEKLQELYKEYGHDTDMAALFSNAARNDSKIDMWIKEAENPVKTKLDRMAAEESKMINTIKSSLKDNITIVDELGRYADMRNIDKDLNSGLPVNLNI